MPAANLLGTPGIFLGEERAAVPQGKTSALLYYLAYQGDWVSREDVLYLFWPDTHESKARNNLRQLLSAIRKLPFAGDLETTKQRLRWPVPSDAQAFKKAVTEEAWGKAATCYRGPLLEGFRSPDLPEFESWLELERASLFSQYRSAVFKLSEGLENEGRYAQAAECLGRLHRFEPFDEHVLQHYVRQLGLAEQRSEALSVFEGFCKTLALELDAEPEAATRALVAKIRSGESLKAGRDPSSSYPEPSKRVQRTLPTPPTPFVGREAELGQLTGILRDPTCRLLSLVAAGGMGKTRLAVELAARLEPEFKDGVCFVPFEAISSPELMITALAEALNFTFFGQQDPKEQLFDYLSNKEMLLVADNLEHLVGGSSLFSKLLEAAPELTVLATSRESLLLQAEWVYDVTGMDSEPGASQENDAVNLFVQTAKKAKTGFELDEENRDAVTAICQQVGGMPLAIELAASWLRVLMPEDIARELAESMDILEGQTRDAPERHWSIRAVFEQSWHRLSAREQEVLAKLSVFRGGFTKDAAESVTGVGLPILFSLVNKSFLRVLSGGRFDRHPLVHEFCLEKLAGLDDVQSVHERHAEYFLELAEEAEPHLRGKEQIQWLGYLEEDHENLLAVLEWSLIPKRIPLGLKLAISVARFWEIKGHFQLGRFWLEKLLNFDAKLSTNDLKAEALNIASFLAMYQGDFMEGRQLSTKSLHLAREIGNKRVIAWSLHDLAAFAANQNNYQEARKLNEKSLTLFRKLRDQYGTASTLSLLGSNAYGQNNYSEAIKLYEESLALFRELNDYVGTANVLNNLGSVNHDQGKYAKAKLLFKESLVLHQKLDNRRGIANSLSNLGRIAAYQGHPREAKELWDKGLVIRRELGVKSNIAYSLVDIAVLLKKVKAFKQSAKLFAAAESLYITIGASPDTPTIDEIQQSVEYIREQLGHDRFEFLWQEGKQLSMDEAIELALGSS